MLLGKQGKENEEGPQMLTDGDLIGAAYLHLAHASVSKLIEAVQHQIRTYSLHWTSAGNSVDGFKPKWLLRHRHRLTSVGGYSCGKR
jgi:hypothetical protein